MILSPNPWPISHRTLPPHQPFPRSQLKHKMYGKMSETRKGHWHFFNRIKRIQWKSADKVPGLLLCNQNAGEWSQIWAHPTPQPLTSYPAWDRRLLIRLLGFTGGAVVKNLPAKQERPETWVWSLCQKDCLEEEMATHSSILAWRLPWTEKLGGLQSRGLQRVRYDWMTEHSTSKGNHCG